MITYKWVDPRCPCGRRPESAKHLLMECRVYTEKRKERRNAPLERLGWKEVSTRLGHAKQAANFIKSLGLIDQFKSSSMD